MPSEACARVNGLEHQRSVMMKEGRRTRPNREHATAVDQGINMLNEMNRIEVARYLLSMGLSLRVIGRVISDPDRRRGMWPRTIR